MRTLFSILLFISLIHLILSACPPETVYRRTFDGTCNNQSPGKEHLGSTFSLYRRSREGTAYADGMGEPINAGRPNPRNISRILLVQGNEPVETPSSNSLSLLSIFFGQFISHDIGFTVESTDPSDDISIPLEPDDPFLFLLDGTRKSGITPFLVTHRGLSEFVDGQREFYNNQSHFIDGSAIYYRDKNIMPRYLDGAKFILQDEHVVTLLFGFNAGKNVSIKNYLPRAGDINATIILALPNLDSFPAAADERSPQTASLNVIHLLFEREHNRLVDELALKHPDWNDTQLFEKARVINIAQLQHITYKEFLPAMFGSLQKFFYLGPYLGYDEDVDPSLSNLFDIAAYRFGHTAIPELVPLYEDCGQRANETRGLGGVLLQASAPGGPLDTLQQVALAGGTHELFKSMLYTPLEKFDHLIHPIMRNIIIPVDGVVGFDIASLDINRGRANGLPGWDVVYEAWNGILPGWKKIYGRNGCTSDETSPAPDDWECFSSWMVDNATLVNMTREIYGKVSAIDPWFAFLVEKKAVGSPLGRTGTKVILEQFKRLRAGDRFFYLRLPLVDTDPLFGTPPLTWPELFNITKVTMADLIRRNLPELAFSKQVQDSAFLVPTEGYFSSLPQCAGI